MFIVVCVCVLCSFVFFFKQKTAYEMRISDWSSDVCSSDLLALLRGAAKGVEAPYLFGLALSGGGIRSATFSLGVLQRLALARLLGCVDYLSTVSGDRKRVV